MNECVDVLICLNEISLTLLAKIDQVMNSSNKTWGNLALLLNRWGYNIFYYYRKCLKLIERLIITSSHHTLDAITSFSQPK